MWAKRQYENFTVGSFLIPRRLRQDFYNVYAYCRWSDNLSDEVSDRQQALSLMGWWEGQLALCYSGRPAHPVMVALQSTIQTHALDRGPFLDLLSAFRQDQHLQRYDDDDSLLDYCQRSANPVGRIVLQLGHCSTPETVALSDQICTGLQLANFCQDIARDAAIGRIYLPRSRWQGLDSADFGGQRPNSRLQEILRVWVHYARGFFERGQPLTGMVPKWLATDVDLFSRGGLAILQAIEDARFDVWTQRPTVSKWAKAKLMVKSVLARRTRNGATQE